MFCYLVHWLIIFAASLILRLVVLLLLVHTCRYAFSAACWFWHDAFWDALVSAGRAESGSYGTDTTKPRLNCAAEPASRYMYTDLNVMLICVYFIIAVAWGQKIIHTHISCSESMYSMNVWFVLVLLTCFNNRI